MATFPIVDLTRPNERTVRNAGPNVTLTAPVVTGFAERTATTLTPALTVTQPA